MQSCRSCILSRSLSPPISAIVSKVVQNGCFGQEVQQNNEGKDFPIFLN